MSRETIHLTAPEAKGSRCDYVENGRRCKSDATSKIERKWMGHKVVSYLCQGHLAERYMPRDLAKKAKRLADQGTSAADKDSTGAQTRAE